MALTNATAPAEVTTLPIKPLTAELQKGWLAHKMDVSVTDTKKAERVLIGSIMIAVPTLDAVEGLTGYTQNKNDKGELEVTEDGLPVYSTNFHNWLQGTIFAQAKNQARNKLASKSLEIKGNTPIATDWEGLTTPAEGGARGLTIMSEVRSLFGAFVAKLGKSAKMQKAIASLISSVDSIVIQSENNKAKFLQYVNDFAETLEAEQVEKYSDYLQKVIDACESEEEEF